MCEQVIEWDVHGFLRGISMRTMTSKFSSFSIQYFKFVPRVIFLKIITHWQKHIAGDENDNS